MINNLFLIPFLFAFNLVYANDLKDAREAAPSHITDNASFMVWEKYKFVLSVKGSYKFVCFVLRDSKGRYEPSCLNEVAMESVFPVYEFQTKQLQNGVSIQSIYAEIEKMHKAGTFATPQPEALVYMMSPKNKFYDHFSNKLVDVLPHIMLYTPKIGV